MVSVFHTIADIHPRSGGTARAAVDLVDALCAQGSFRPVILTQARAGEQGLPSKQPAVRRIVAEARTRTAFTLGLPFFQAMRSALHDQRPALIHSHGLWLPVNHWAAMFSRKHRIPMVIQPHGMLEPWALKHRAWKKRLAMWTYQRRDVQSARVLVASCIEELENIRRVGFCQPIAVIPNGVQVDPVRRVRSLGSAAEGPSHRVLFLSRIHPKKGLDNLIRAWSLLEATGWVLQIAGPDEAGYLEDVMRLVRQLGIDRSVQYVGVVEGAEKSELYVDADVFVLPTYSENFGIVVAEALAHGVPVITTKGAPWRDLETFDCGWWVDIGIEPLARALREAMQLSKEQRQAMGERGRSYVRRYNWDAIARQTAEVYRWVLGERVMPDCVITD